MYDAPIECSDSRSGAAEWQHPFVNVFKLCDVEQKKDVDISGKVVLRMDETIHKRVFKITGAIPAVNYIKLPKAKGLALHGRFCYLQVKFEPGALFSIHLEVTTADGNACRVSVGNIFKPENLKKKAGCVQYTLRDPPTGWTLLALDLAAALGPGASPYSSLKSLQLCSTLTVRGAFTSDIRFGLQTLPREMVMCHSLDPSLLSQVWLPAEPEGVPEPPLNKPIKKSSRAVGKPRTTPRSDTQQPAAADQAATPTGSKGRKPGSTPAAAPLASELSSFTITSEPSASSVCSAAGSGVAGSGMLRPSAPPLLQPEPFMALHRLNGYTGEYARSVLYCPTTDELVYPAGSVVVAMTAGSSSGNKGSGNNNNNSSSSSSSSSTRSPQGCQRFFLGHSAFVCCLALGGEGSLLATGQEGKQALIRVWDFKPQQQQAATAADAGAVADASNAESSGTCLAVLCAHASHLAALDVSEDGRALVAVGCDSQARQTIALWDISGVKEGRRAMLLVKQVTNHNVRVLRFSPFEPDHFMAAGRDSVRTYRLKGSELRGISVRLQPPVNKSGQVVGTATASIVCGPKIFTDIAFEATPAALQLPTQHVFVSTASGAVFQIDYAKRLLVAVYQLHVGAINSLAIGDGLAATASDDRCLRLWPLDFTTYLMEAEHEGPVTSACLAAAGPGGGGLGVVVGCEDGVLGMLDVVSQRYTTLLRSHCGPVTCVVGHRDRPEYCTTSSDGSVRIWDITRHQQLYEFGAGGDSAGAAAPLCAAYHPQHYQLAVGYERGVLRVFDVATTTLLLEQQQHQGAVMQLLFTPDGSRLLSCGSDGKVIVADTTRHYAPIKVLLSPAVPATNPSSISQGVCAAVGADGSHVAVGQQAAQPGSNATGSSGATITLCAAASLEAVVCFETTAEGFVRLEISPDGCELWALTTTASTAKDDAGDAPGSCSIMRFCTATGSLLQVMSNPHGAAAVTAFALDPAMTVIATGGADHLVKLWAVSRREELEQLNQQPGGVVSQLPAYQSFTGHMGPVTGAAFLGTQLVTVGQDGNVAVWNMNTSSTAASYQQQQRGIREPHPDLNVTMRSWLERPPAAEAAEAAVTTSAGGVCAGEAGSSVVSAAALARRVAGAAACVAGGVVVPELHAALQDPGISPSPLFSCSAQQQTHTTSRSGATAATAAAGGGVVPAPVRCSALLGSNAHVAGGLLWLRQQGLLAHPTGNVLVLSHLATHQQQLLQHHSQPIGAVALSCDGQLLATASAGPEPASGCAEVCVWELSGRRLRLVLCQHPLDCQLLEFSPDGCWLVSFGGRQLVLWDLETGEAAAIGKTHKAVSGIAWLPWRPLPQFLTSGGDGLLLWSLQPTFLEQRSLTVPDAAGAAFSAVCSAASSGGLPHSSMSGEELDPAQQAAVKAQAACTAFAADEAGGIWQLAVGEGRLLGCAKVANLEPGQTATRLQWSQRSAALAAATSSGALLRYTCSSADSSSSDGVVHQWWAAGSVSSAGGAGVLPQWVAAGALQLDGPITSLQLEPQLLCEGLVGSAAATAWYVDMREQQQAPLLAGHAAEITGLVGSAAAGGRDGSGVVASLCEDGWLALWQTGSGSQVLPLAEFRSEQAVSSVAFQPGCVGCVVGYMDGRLALFDLTAAAGAAAGAAAAGSGGVGVICWSVVRHASPVISVALHPSQPLVMAASRDGLITVTNSDSSRLVASCRDLTGSTIPLHALAVQAAPASSSSTADGSAPGSIAAAAWLDRLLVFRTPWQASQAHVVCSYQCPEVPEVLPPVRSSVSFIPGSANLLLFASPCLQAAALLFDCAAGQPLRTLELPGSPTSLAACPSGQLLAFGLEDGRVVVADASGEDSSVWGCARGAGEWPGIHCWRAAAGVSSRTSDGCLGRLISYGGFGAFDIPAGLCKARVGMVGKTGSSAGSMSMLHAHCLAVPLVQHDMPQAV